jgi:membrane protease YdiL (CAAX protease family)
MGEINLSIESIRKIIVFAAASYLSALIFDVMLLNGLLPTNTLLWGFLRMWSPTLSVILCLLIFKEGILKIRDFLKISAKLLRLYLLSPLIVYMALGIYILIAVSFGLFDFSAYVDLVARGLTETLKDSEADIAHLAQISAYAQIALAYVAAVTLNAIFALGEEIGWRGYLYSLLGSKPTFKAALIIGVLWGFWHASSIILLGHNYQFNRLVGVPLFTALTVLFTYPQIIITYMAEGSVLPSSAFHGAINAIWGLTMIATRLPIEVGELILGLGLVGIIAWTTLNIMLHISVKKKSSLSELDKS